MGEHLYAVIDVNGEVMFASLRKQECNEHINDAINNFPELGAEKWVIREYEQVIRYAGSAEHG